MKKILSIFVMLVLALAGAAEARVLSGSVEQVGDIEISVPAVVVGGVDADGKIETGADVDIDVSAEADDVENLDDDSDDDPVMSITAESKVAVEEVDEDEASDDEQSSNEIAVRAVEVRGWNPEKKAEILAASLTRSEVRSDEDLSNFAATMVINDENIDSVEVNSDEIEVVYKFPAKFLGIFKTNVRAHVTADSSCEVKIGQGCVKVKFSWLAFLYKIDASVKASVLADTLDIQLTELGHSETATQAAIRADVLDVVGAVLRVKHDTVKNSIGNIR